MSDTLTKIKELQDIAAALELRVKEGQTIRAIQECYAAMMKASDITVLLESADMEIPDARPGPMREA